MRNWQVLAAFAGAMVGAPVQAAWHKAESAHFVVYANDDAKDVARFAALLERFHTAMTIIAGRKDAAPSPSNRVVIFAVGNESQVQSLIGDKSRTIAGFYAARAGNSRAFVPNIRSASGENDFALTVLLHEYAHHFLISGNRYAMPRWVNEGAAEFHASTKFHSDGSLGIGMPANHRAVELAYAADVRVEELLDHELYEKRSGKTYDAFYGRAWALYHYLTLDTVKKGPRAGQLDAYIREITSGTSARAAATRAFGDLGVLERDLDRYVQRRTLTSFQLPARMFAEPVVTTSALSAGESAIMPLRIRSQSGVNRQEALALVPRIRKVAEQYPGDGAVFTALAEAEFDAGNDPEAIAAADKAIALDRTQVNAYVQKGYALFRKADAVSGEERSAAFTAAMKPFQALNAIENDHPLPLVYLYRSQAQQGREPTELARHALERASELAPFDANLAFDVASMQAQEGKIGLAKANLAVLAADPHGGPVAKASLALSEQIGALAEGTPWRGAVAVLEEEGTATE